MQGGFFGSATERGWLGFLALLAATHLCEISAEGAVESQPKPPERFVQNVWKKRDGLPDDSVRDVLQTQDGYIWAATPAGLARFDGVRFTVFDRANTPEMPSQECYALAESKDGTLWIACGNELLSYRDHVFAPHRIPDLGPGSQLATVLPAEDGSIWASAWCWLFRFSEGTWTRFDSRQMIWNSAIMALHDGPDGSIFVQSSSGLGRMKKGERDMEHVLDSPFNWVLYFAHPDRQDAFWMVFADPDHRARHLHFLDSARQLRPVEMPLAKDSRVTLFQTDPAGVLWLAGSKGELFRLENGRFIQHLEAERIPEDLLSICRDKEDNVWLGTRSGGLRCLTPKRVLSLGVREGLPAEAVHALRPSGRKAMWLATEKGIVSAEDGAVMTAHPVLSQIQPVRSFAEAPNGTWWIGTHNLLYSLIDGRLDQHEGPFPAHRAAIRCIHARGDGSALVGTLSGVWQLSPGRAPIIVFQARMATDDVRVVFEDTAGSIWIGTHGSGLYRVTQGQTTQFKSSDGLASDFPSSIYEDSRNVLWIGTDRGLSRYENGRFSIIGSRHGLLDDGIRQLLEDDSGNLWVGCRKGLFHVSLEELDAISEGKAQTVHSVVYDQSDGLPSIELAGAASQPACAKTAEGQLWFATSKGVAVVEPTRDRHSPPPPKLVIEQVRANGQVVFGGNAAHRPKAPGVSFRTFENGLRFPPGAAQTLEIHYTANTFLAPHRVRFKYKLEPVEQEWTDAESRRVAFFTNLRPGQHWFRLMASDGFGNWSETEASMGLFITPYVHQTWWFWTGSATLLVSAAALLILWRSRWQRQIHQLELQHRLDEQRAGMTRDLHDDLGLSLTQIVRLIDELNEQPDPQRAASKPPTSKIAALAQDAVSSFGQFLWLNNPRFDNLDDLLAHLREYAAQTLQEARILAALDFPDEVPSLPVPAGVRRHLFAALKEALNNGMKHSKARRIAIRVQLEARQMIVEFEDDGVGFDPGATRAGHGLANMKKRAAEMNGSFELESTIGSGTRLRFKVPLAA